MFVELSTWKLNTELDKVRYSPSKKAKFVKFSWIVMFMMLFYNSRLLWSTAKTLLWISRLKRQKLYRTAFELADMRLWFSPKIPVIFTSMNFTLSIEDANCEQSRIISMFSMTEFDRDAKIVSPFADS